MSTSELISFISKTKENEFTKNTLIPLLKKKGFENVEFHGGVCEEGKDVIARLTTALGKKEHWVFQVKRISENSITRQKPDWLKFTSQLRQAKKKSYAVKECVEVIPDKVIAIVSNPISVRLMSDSLHDIDINYVEVYDACDIAEWIEKDWPSYLRDVGGIDVAISKGQLDELQNFELSAALKFNENIINYEKSFSHLNFILGNISSSSILNRKASGYNKEVSLGDMSWKKLRTILSKSPTTFLEDFFSSLDEAEIDIRNRLEKYESSENQKLLNEEVELERRISNLQSNLNNACADIKVKLISKKEKEKENSNVDINSILSHVNSIQSNTWTTLKKMSEREYRNEAYSLDIKNIELISEDVRTATDSLNKVKENVIRYPKYKIIFYGRNLSLAYNEAVESSIDIYKQIKEKNYLHDLPKLMNLFEGLMLLNNFCHLMHDTLGFIPIDFTENEYDVGHFEISPFSIFDTGKNIALFGMAGAGKTTTLHMYCKHVIESYSDEKQLLFAPLNRMVDSVKVSCLGLLKSSRGDTATMNVERFLKCFLIQKGGTASKAELNALKNNINSKEKQVVLVLDGLDEVATEIPWIIKAINQLPREIPKIQVIVSSREAVSYLTDIRFLGISLQPFTKKQLRTFISNWNWPEDICYKNLLTSIEDKDLFEVIQNPLLATLVCTLHAKGQNVPNNERDIYAKYVRLLCGIYDDHKKVSRNTNDSDTLETFSSRVAMIYHREQVKEISKVNLIKKMNQKYSHKYSEDFIKRTIEELIDPCNILVLTGQKDNLKFYHLRIQEYLVSRALQNECTLNEVVSYTTEDWWRGALYLYAFNCQIENIIETARSELGSNLYLSKSTIKLMIRATDPKRQKGLNEILNMFVKESEYGDDFVAFLPDHEDTKAYF